MHSRADRKALSVQFRLPLKFLAFAALSLSAAGPAHSQSVAGSYLAARQAGISSDFRTAAYYFAQALAHDADNPALMEKAMTAYIGLGQVDRAVAVASRLTALGHASHVASIILLADGMRQGDFDWVVASLDANQMVEPIVGRLLRAWAQAGQGRISKALESFDQVAAKSGAEILGLYHKALALAMIGDHKAADEIFSNQDHSRQRSTRRGIIAHAQVLSQLDRNADAIKLLDTAYGTDPDHGIAKLRTELEAGITVPFDVVTKSKDGAAEVFLVIAGMLTGEDVPDSYTLLYSRIAEFLKPNHADALLFNAALLEQLKQYELATESYNRIPVDHPAFTAAELGRAEALRLSGNTNAAIEALQQLARSQAENPAVHVMLGDVLRELERYDDASKVYDAAIKLYENPQPKQWRVFFVRGITHEREGRWELAEADFRKSLELNPGQPQVLNYLGYSLVELGMNLDEAMELIEEAAAAEPNSGYIVDSLGWVQFRMGDHFNAVANLERAAELLPSDPVVNDHLGDAYWAVGRRVEAEFQWRRAISFDPEEKDAKRIRRKLEAGLDAVLAEEGAPPIKVTAQER